MKKQYILKEFQSFTRGIVTSDIHFVCLPVETFDQLEQFVLTNRSEFDNETLEIMSISSKRGIGKLITAKNYVGIITMKDGTEIEILPKIYSRSKQSEIKIKKLFLEMVKTVLDIPYKAFSSTNLNSDKMNVYEIYIRMFINELFKLVRRGLKSNYVSRIENEKFVRGKILITQNIRKNLIEKNKFYLDFDEFSLNRVENRLIKSTIRFLYLKTNDVNNKKDLLILLNIFDVVDYSANYSSDFTKCAEDRTVNDYGLVLGLCKVFLLKHSFTSFSGKEVAYALLFPMEKLFESYVTFKFRKNLNRDLYLFTTQNRKYYLVDLPNKKFSIIPDIVLCSKDNENTYLFDTKWKQLSALKSNYGITQSDMYQMYAYQKKYLANSVTLIYPLSESIDIINNYIRFESSDSIKINVFIIDLFNVESSIKELITTINLKDI